MENKIQNIFKNPMIISGIITLLLTIILCIKTGFHFPEYYTDRAFADKLAQTVARDEVYEKIKYLVNPDYRIYNLLFQIWGWFIACFTFLAIFKVKHFSDFKYLKIFNKKLFVYLWVNISYVVYSVLFIIFAMIDITKFVYHWTADSYSIPLFLLIFMFLYSAIIYYPIINILSFITYNTKIKNVLLQIFWSFGFLFLLFFMLCTTISKFTYINVILNIYYIIWITLIIYSIGFNKYKNNIKTI